MAEITVTTVGNSVTVRIDEGETLSDALAKANVEPDSDGLDVERNGELVEDPESVTPADGDQILATPKNVALGA